MKEFALKKFERIRRSVEFEEIFKKGEKRHTENFLVILHPNQQKLRRLGIVVGKKAGTAVERNRIKRLVREFFRLNKAHFPESVDLLFVAKRKPEKLSYADVAGELKVIFSAPFQKTQQNP